MTELIFATGNKGKLAEVKKIFENSQYKIVSLYDIGDVPEIEETGSTFEDNAFIKICPFAARRPTNYGTRPPVYASAVAFNPTYQIPAASPPATTPALFPSFSHTYTPIIQYQ